MLRKENVDHVGTGMGLSFLCHPWCWVHFHSLCIYIYLSVNCILLCMPSKTKNKSMARLQESDIVKRSLLVLCGKEL